MPKDAYRHGYSTTSHRQSGEAASSITGRLTPTQILWVNRPPMQADERDDKEIVKILLDNGAKLDTIVGDQTPLSIAKQEGNPKIIALLDSHIPS